MSVVHPSYMAGLVQNPSSQRASYIDGIVPGIHRRMIMAAIIQPTSAAARRRQPLTDNWMKLKTLSTLRCISSVRRKIELDSTQL